MAGSCCDNSIMSPFASTQRPRMPGDSRPQFISPLFQFDVWVSNRKRLLVVWALQVLRLREDESRCQRWDLNASRIPGTLQQIGLPHVQIQRSVMVPLCPSCLSCWLCGEEVEIGGVTDRGEGSNPGDKPLSTGGSGRKPTRALDVAEACRNLSFPFLILRIDVVAPREDCGERAYVERTCAGQGQSEWFGQGLSRQYLRYFPQMLAPSCAGTSLGCLSVFSSTISPVS